PPVNLSIFISCVGYPTIGTALRCQDGSAQGRRRERRRRKMPGGSLKATPSGNDRKPADLNSEEAAVRSRNVAATQNFLDRLRDAGHDPDEVFASSVGGGNQPPRGR